MQINIRRIARKEKYTIGRMYIDGKYICDTLEPPDRGLTQEMGLDTIIGHKIAGHTAIPTGTYRVLITKSLRFGRWLPLIYGVPGFDGIRIHGGNTVEDTSGCVIVGWNRLVGRVLNSRSALQMVINGITEGLAHDEEVTIRVE